VFLCGDAAHVTTRSAGSGSTAASTRAWDLANLLGGDDRSWMRYERRRRPLKHQIRAGADRREQKQLEERGPRAAGEGFEELRRTRRTRRGTRRTDARLVAGERSRCDWAKLFPFLPPEDSTTADYYQQCLRIAERADALGYSSIKTVEHSSTTTAGIRRIPACSCRRWRRAPGASASSRRGDPGVSPPGAPRRRPRDARQHEPGRLDAGFGRAFLPKEFEVYGVPMSRAASASRKHRMIRRMWTAERVFRKAVSGTGRRQAHARVVQKPHPPVWIAAISTEESFLYAARNGSNLMIVPYAGKPPAAGARSPVPQVWAEFWPQAGRRAGAVAQFAYVAEKRAEAQSGFEASAGATWRPSPTRCSRGGESRRTSIRATTRWRHILATTPDRSSPAAGIRRHRRRTWWLRSALVDASRDRAVDADQFRRLDRPGAFRTLELFASKVMSNSSKRITELGESARYPRRASAGPSVAILQRIE